MVLRRKLTIDGVVWHFSTLSDNRGITLRLAYIVQTLTCRAVAVCWLC